MSFFKFCFIEHLLFASDYRKSKGKGFLRLRRGLLVLFGVPFNTLRKISSWVLD